MFSCVQTVCVWDAQVKSVVSALLTEVSLMKHFVMDRRELALLLASPSSELHGPTLILQRSSPSHLLISYIERWIIDTRARVFHWNMRSRHVHATTAFPDLHAQLFLGEWNETVEISKSALYNREKKINIRCRENKWHETIKLLKIPLYNETFFEH